MKQNFIYQLVLLYHKMGLAFDLFLIVAFVTIWFIINVKIKSKATVWLNRLGFAFGLFGIVLLGLISRITSTVQYNIIPFRHISNATIYYIQGIVSNILFFVPIGLTLPYLLVDRCRKPISVTIILGFLISFSVEVLQLILHRGVFETEDIIINTFGTAVGILSFVFSKRVRRKDDKT